MSKPSKRSQLLAHLRLRPVPTASIPRMLNLSKHETATLIAKLEREQLIEIKGYPAKIDPHGKCDRVALKQLQEKKSA